LLQRIFFREGKLLSHAKKYSALLVFMISGSISQGQLPLPDTDRTAILSLARPGYIPLPWREFTQGEDYNLIPIYNL
jgi:hypothetical protein